MTHDKYCNMKPRTLPAQYGGKKTEISKHTQNNMTAYLIFVYQSHKLIYETIWFDVDDE